MLTVRAGRAHSHASWGWETFTDKVISLINQHREGGRLPAVNGLARPERKEARLLIHTTPPYSESSASLATLCAADFLAVTILRWHRQWLEQHGEKTIDWTPSITSCESE